MMINILRNFKAGIRALWWRLKFRYQISATGQQPRIFYLMGLGNKFPNLGDQAQAAAISMWLGKHFDMPVVELKTYQIETCLPALKRRIRNNDIVFLQSGGTFGDDWCCSQLIRESIIASLGSNKIIQLPQTIFYSATGDGQLAAARSQQVINAHPDLLVFGRDFHSAQIARKLFQHASILARPDMVLSLQDVVQQKLGKEIARRSRDLKKILLIIRNDKESVYDIADKQGIVSQLLGAGYQVQLWDTNVEDTFSNPARLKIILKYLEFISAFDAVVTDRYHGLIFSVLVKRPCVVLKTHNHKLTSAFDWFNGVNFVRRIDSTSALLDVLDDMQKLQEFVAPGWNAVHFDLMAAEVKKFLETYPKNELGFPVPQTSV